MTDTEAQSIINHGTTMANKHIQNTKDSLFMIGFMLFMFFFLAISLTLSIMVMDPNIDKSAKKRAGIGAVVVSIIVMLISAGVLYILIAYQMGAGISTYILVVLFGLSAFSQMVTASMVADDNQMDNAGKALESLAWIQFGMLLFGIAYVFFTFKGIYKDINLVVGFGQVGQRKLSGIKGLKDLLDGLLADQPADAAPSS